MAIPRLHPSVVENLPKFVFPHQFMALVPEDYEAVIPTAEDRRRVLEALLTIKASAADYLYCEIAEMVHYGVIRDMRRFSGGIMVRLDGYEIGPVACDKYPWQILLLLDDDWKVVAYTSASDELKKLSCLRVAYRRQSCSVSEGDVGMVLKKVSQVDSGAWLTIGPEYDPVRSLMIRRNGEDASCYDARIILYHLPWSFVQYGLSWEQIEAMVRKYIEKGLGAIVRDSVWLYDDVTVRIREDLFQMGIYTRLLCHRFMAEYGKDREALALIDSVQVAEDNTPQLWVARPTRSTWSETIDYLYRHAIVPDARDYFGRLLAPIDIRRILVFCALNGHPEAKLRVEELSGS